MSKSIDFGNEITGKIKESIKAKLADLGSYIDEELPDYIMIMIANRKSKAQMVEDLQLFLSDNTDSFVTWLQDMLQQLEALSSAAAAPAKPATHSTSGKKLEKQTSVEQKQEKRRSTSENVAASKPVPSESDESGQSRNADTSFRQELDVKGGEDDLGVEKSEEGTTSTSHHRHGQKKSSPPVFDEEDPKPVGSLRRRAVEQVLASRRSDYRRRSRSKTPPAPPRRSRDSRSRSRSPRGSYYTKRVVGSILGSRRSGDGRRAAPVSASGRRSGGHDRRSRDTPSSDNSDHENESAAAPVSSQVRVVQRKPAVSAALQPTTSLLMRAIAEAKSSIEGVPQSEIKVPPNSSLATAKAAEEREKARSKEASESEDSERDAAVKPRHGRGGVMERSGDRVVKSLHVLSTSDGGFISRARQVQMKKNEDRKKKIMSKLLLRQIEQEEQELAEEGHEEEKDGKSKEKEKEGEEETKSEKAVEEIVQKKKEDDEAVRAFNKSAVMDKSTKTVYLDQAASTPITEGSSSDVLVKALFRSSSEAGGEQITIPVAPAKNNPQFIVTLDGVDESMFFGTLQRDEQTPPPPQPQPLPPIVATTTAKLPMSQRLGPLKETVQSRLGPPVEMEQDLQQDVESSEMQADFQSENVDTSNQAEPTEVEMKPAPTANRSAERCRFWPNCKAGESCAFVHPSQPCKAFPNCRFGARCLYIHPDCKFDTACLNPECPYTHRGNATVPAPVPQPQVLAPVVATPALPPVVPAAVPATAPSSVPLCKYFPNCTNPFCLFSHPKPCRFGSSCYYKATCTFWHPPSTVVGTATAAASKLRWTAPSLAQSTAQSAPVAAPADSGAAKSEQPSQSTATAVN